MRAKRMKPGVTGWAITGAVILAAELLDQRTMSEVFRDWSRSPTGKYVLLPGWAYLTAHLFGFIPVKYDPLSQLWLFVKKAPSEIA
jgi:hypothetical protein